MVHYFFSFVHSISYLMSYRINEATSEYIDEKLLRAKSSTKGSKVFKTQVDISKVNLDVIKEWINQVISEQLPDDDIVIDYIGELLVADDHPDIVSIQVQLKDFLGEKEAKVFCERLWRLLISAQEDPDGIPAEILQKRREEYEALEKQQQKQEAKTNYNRSQYNAGKRESENDREGERERYRGDRHRYRGDTERSERYRDREGDSERSDRYRDREGDRYREGYRDNERSRNHRTSEHPPESYSHNDFYSPRKKEYHDRNDYYDRKYRSHDSSYRESRYRERSRSRERR